MNSSTFEAAMALILQRWPFPPEAAEMQKTYVEQVRLSVSQWTGKRAIGFAKAINAYIGEKRQFGRPSPESIVDLSLAQAGESSRDKPATDANAARLADGYYAVRQFLEQRWLLPSSRLDDVRHYIPRLSEDECRRFWSGILKRRLCRVCQHGHALDLGLASEEKGTRMFRCLGPSCPARDAYGPPCEGAALEDGSDDETRRATAERMVRGAMWWKPGGSQRRRILGILESDPYFSATVSDELRESLLNGPRRKPEPGTLAEVIVSGGDA